MSTRITHRQEWTHDDRRDYPPGPWDDEPDKVQWVDAFTDLDCLIVRNPSGALCGYVGVPPGHPWHGQGYDEVHDSADVSVHGGLTFAAGCQENAPEGHGVCHVPLPGRPDDVWWLGFDCSHGGIDVIPLMLKYEAERSNWLPAGETWPPPGWPREQYRDVAYVTAQCEALAVQAAAAR